MFKFISIAVGTTALGATLLAAHYHGQPTDTRTEKVFDSRVTVEGASLLQIKATLGELHVLAGTSNALEVHAIRWTKQPTSESGRRWLNESRLEVVHRGTDLSVIDHPYWERTAVEGSNNFNGGLDLVIKVPAGLRLQFDVATGTVEARGAYRSVSGGVGAGTISARLDRGPKDDSSLKVGAGTIKLDVPSGTNVDLSADAGVGSITGLPGENSKTRGLHLGDRRSARVGSGGASLAMHVGTGQIAVSSMSHLMPEPKVTEITRGGSPEYVWSGDVDAMSDMAQVSVKEREAALGEAQRALTEVGPQIEMAMKQAQPEIDKAMRELKPQIEQAMKEAQSEVDRAMKESKPELDNEMAELGPEIQRALRAAKPEMEKDLANIGPIVSKALKDAKPQLDKANRAQVERAMRQLQKLGPQMEQAMNQASRAIDKAAIEMNKHGNKELSESVRKAVNEALRSASEALRESSKATTEAVNEAKHGG